MNALMKNYWALGLLAIILAAALTITLVPYKGNVSALFHVDEITQEQYGVTPNFVVLTVPGYDGEQYYAIAKRMAEIFQPSHWPMLAEHPSQAYSYQRFLLPFTAFVLAAGQAAALPYTFLIIQLAALLGTGFIMLKRFPGKPLYAFALALCPAALLGLHFSLAEPLTIFLLTAFLVRYTKHSSIRLLDVILLSLFVLTREINIFFIGLLFLWFIAHKQWKNAVLMCIPGIAFLGLHGLIYAIFYEAPFLWSTDKHALPFAAIMELITGMRGYTAYTLSAIALFIGFVLPALIWSGVNIGKKTMNLFLPLTTFIFLCLMLLMPDHIWGSITSIGRVITPVYPLFVIQAATRDTLSARAISVAILILGLTIGIALALMPHPFILS